MAQAVNGEQQAASAQGNAQSAPPSGQLQASLRQLAGTLTERASSSLSGKLGGATDRLTDYAQQGGGSGLLAAVTGADKLASGESPVKAALSGGLAGATEKVKGAVKGVTGSVLGKKGKSGGQKLKVTNIVERIDVGVPVDLAYDQWTQFAEFPKFMKKVEQVEQVSDEKLRWKAQVFWSHRSWESTITEQVPNEKIVWRSKGDKGYVDGAVTFHEITPNLTRVIVVLEYHPQGLFEKTGNLWRAQGRRVRLELKHFQRQVMTHAMLHPDEVEGWRGEIHDGEVVSDGVDEPDEPEPAPRSRRRRTADGDRKADRDDADRRRAPAKKRSRT